MFKAHLLRVVLGLKAPLRLPVAPRTLRVFPWAQGLDAAAMAWGGPGFPLWCKTSLPRVGSLSLTVVCIKKKPSQQVKGLNYCIKCIALRTVQPFACAR